MGESVRNTSSGPRLELDAVYTEMLIPLVLHEGAALSVQNARLAALGDLALALDASELVVEKLSKEQRAVNALARWRLGPFSITQLDSVTEWLDKGIALVLIDVFDGTMPLEITPEALEAFAGAVSQLPRDRCARAHARPPALRARVFTR